MTGPRWSRARRVGLGTVSERHLKKFGRGLNGRIVPAWRRVPLSKRSSSRSIRRSDRRPRRRRSAADRRRRRHGEDADAGAPPGGAGRARRRSAAHPAADVLATGGAGDDPARGAPDRGAAPAATRSPGRGPFTPSPTACCATTRPRWGSIPGSRCSTARTPPTCWTACATIGRSRAPTGGFRARGPASPSIPAPSTRSSRCARRWRRAFPGAWNGKSSCAASSPRSSRPRPSAPFWTTTTCCSTGST